MNKFLKAVFRTIRFQYRKWQLKKAGDKLAKKMEETFGKGNVRKASMGVTFGPGGMPVFFVDDGRTPEEKKEAEDAELKGIAQNLTSRLDDWDGTPEGWKKTRDYIDGELCATEVYAEGMEKEGEEKKKKK